MLGSVGVAECGHSLFLCLCQVEFGVNAEAQKFMSKSGKTLSEALNTFTSDINTLVNKTIEDTMINAKQYEAARWVENGTSCFLSAGWSARLTWHLRVIFRYLQCVNRKTKSDCNTATRKLEV